MRDGKISTVDIDKDLEELEGFMQEVEGGEGLEQH